jgi:murein DD-endopeptidase MepM/ murein hydrolase activator NlpD
MNQIGESIKNGADAVIGAVQDFGQRTGNLFTGDGFNTNAEVKEIKLARYIELLNNEVLGAANNDGSNVSHETEAMMWKKAQARFDEMSKLAKDLVLTPANARLGNNDLFDDPYIKLEKKSDGSLLPISAGTKYSITSEYGYRINPTDGSQSAEFHEGIDIAVEEGTSVRAIKDGVVVDDRLSDKGFGNRVVIRHSDDTYSLYAHNSENLVQKGQVVKAGDEIAKSGDTGRSTGPHIHFEIVQGRAKDRSNNLWLQNWNKKDRVRGAHRIQP